MIPLPFLPVVDGVFFPRHPLERWNGARRQASICSSARTGTSWHFFGLGRPELVGARRRESGALGRQCCTRCAERRIDRALSASARRPDPRKSIPAHSCSPSGATASSVGPVCSWPRPRPHTVPARIVYLFELESPAFGGCWDRATRSSSRSSSEWWMCPLCRCSRGPAPTCERLSTQMQQAWLAFARHGDRPAPRWTGRCGSPTAVHDGLRPADRSRRRTAQRGAVGLGAAPTFARARRPPEDGSAGGRSGAYDHVTTEQTQSRGA